MGYYLNIDYPELEHCSLGHKFYGYLSEDELKKCWSYQYLENRLHDPDINLLNVWWSNYAFELPLLSALIFLRLFARDAHVVDGQDIYEEINGVIEQLHIINPEIVRFSMG